MNKKPGILKITYWDLKKRITRFNYYNAILKRLPGFAGIVIRNRIIPKYFAQCGEGISILEGASFKGIDKLTVGNHVHIGNDNFLQASGGITLGDHVMLGPGVKIWSINHKYDNIHIPIAEQGYDLQSVYIGDGVWLGANVFVLPGVYLPQGCVVSACSVVHKKTYQPYSILAGNPCRVIGIRTNHNQ